ncbi:WD40/YVTN/BNR-like repeat-containing protein [Foetidibacter luteolus]|uniref:WD40/YVTN/BNR-like repeat-containing protein n=1 Tax=Foetidibacter luteolus TaxID=2608880 RepID=UPI00129BBF3E|nr:glycosyl hydrolase [Foetidibacter luteolus]
MKKAFSKMHKTFTIIVVALAVGVQLHAQQLDTALYKTMKYRNVGPNRGGRSLGIAGSSSRKNEYYFGATGGGLWKTTDGGLTWKPVTDGQINCSSVGAVGISESNPDIVYIGTGESEFRGNIMQGDGIYKSTDAGKTWKNVGLKNSQTISRVRVHPKNPDIVYVSVLGHAFGANEERGVYKTADGGKSWKKVLYKGDKAGAADLIIDPVNPDIVYASIWEVYRTPWKMWGGGGACGLFKSTDGGETWTELTAKPGMPAGPIGKIGVTVSPVDNKRVWAIVEANEGGVFRSDDGGETWKQTNSDRKLRQRAFYYTRIYADPKDKEGVYVLNVGFFKSVDGGVKFDKTIRVPHGDNHDLWIDPTDPMRMAQANDGGGTISLNGGQTWTDEDFPTAQLYHITASKDFPYHVAGAQQDNTTIAVPSEGWRHMVSRTNSTKGGMGYAYEVGGGESGYIAQDPKNPDIFYAGSYSNTLTRINRITGERREVEPYPRYFMGEAAKTLPERVHWTFPIVFSPVDGNRMYVCSQHVWFTQNGGQTWERISPDLTLGDTATLGESGGIITRDMSGPEIYGTVYALAPSQKEVNTIWAGSDDGLLHITRDHGKSWQNITPPDMPKHTRISIIEASPHKAGTAYVAAKRYQMNDRAPYIWKTDDYGKTWKKIVNGIAAGDFVHAVREDITKPGLLYAGTEHGVLVSFNDGESWSPLQMNLPNAQVPDMAVTEKDLAIATHGRSMYILDDIAPVREYTPEIASKAVHFYKPYYAVRKVQNAVFQYYLAKDVDSVKIEILDAAGKLVQTFKGEKPKPKADSTKSDDDGGDEESFFGGAPKPPTVKAGLNKFEWDLRYPGATGFKGMIMWAARSQMGPVATPGQYQARLTVGGETITQAFEVRLDPRLTSVTEADIQEQFKLAMQVRDETSKANEAVIKIRNIKDSMTKAGVAEKNKKIIDQLSVIEQAIYQVKNQSNQDPLNYPIRLNNKIAALQRIIENGENKPTDDAYKVFKELSAELAGHLAALDKLLQDKTVKKYYSFNLAQYKMNNAGERMGDVGGMEEEQEEEEENY